MGKGRSGRRGPHRPAARKSRPHAKVRGATALLKRGRDAKALRASKVKPALRAASKTSANNTDIAREYVMLEERLVGTSSMAASRQRKEELKRQIAEVMRRNVTEGLKRAARGSQQARLVNAPSTDEVLAMMQTLQAVPSGALRVAADAPTASEPPGRKKETSGVELGRFQALATAEEGGEKPMISFAPATITYAAKFLEKDGEGLEAKLENASEGDLLNMLRNMGVTTDVERLKSMKEDDDDEL